MTIRKVSWFAAATLSAGLCSASFAQVTGTVKLDGKAPEMAEIKGMKNVADCAKMHKDPVYEETVVAGDKGELQNVVISIKAAEGQNLGGSVPSKPAVLDQKGCMYHPHVVALMVGQDMLVKSDDPFLHNVHALSIDNAAFNFGQPAPSQKKIEPFKAAETFKVKCDVHPWMSAWVRVLDNPFFAVTGEEGTFSIDTTGLTDGEYTFVAWHEKYGEQEAKGEVKKGKIVKPLAFTFKSEEKASARPVGPVREASFASLLGMNDCCATK